MDVVKIGTFIKTQRTELNMTQKDLAQKIGCTDKAISRWETGKGLPDMSFIIPLSKELNVSINELLTGEKLICETATPEVSGFVTEFIKKNDETLVEVIEESQKNIRRHSKISLSLLVLFGIQMILYFVLPNFLPGEVNAFIIMLTLSGLTSILVGLTKSRLKWLFPLSVSFVFFFINLFYLTDERFLGFIVSLYFAAGSYIVIAIVSLLVYLHKRFKNR